MKTKFGFSPLAYYMVDVVFLWITPGPVDSQINLVWSKLVPLRVHIRGVVPLLKDNLLVFYYFNTSEIWPDNRVSVMVFNATFKNILIISWRSLLLVEETRVSGENHWPAVSHWQTLSHNVVWSTPCHEWDLNSHV